MHLRLMFWLLFAPIWVPLRLLGYGLSGRPRSRANYYWHGYCPIHHRRQDTADRCAASAAYRRMEIDAMAREVVEEAERITRAESTGNRSIPSWVIIPVILVALLAMRLIV